MTWQQYTGLSIFAIIVLVLFACRDDNDPGSLKAEGTQAMPAGAALASCELKVDGMTCTGCEGSVQEALLKVPGVHSAKADSKTGLATVEYDSTKVDLPKLVTAIGQTGYEAHLPE